MSLEPPSEGVHDTLEALIASVNSHSGPQGYAVVKAHTKTPKDDLIQKVFLRCDWGGKHVVTVREHNRKRATGTWLVNWSFSATRVQMEDGWFLAVQNPEHSHGPTRVGSHPVLRKLTMRRCGLPLQSKFRHFASLLAALVNLPWRRPWNSITNSFWLQQFNRHVRRPFLRQWDYHAVTLYRSDYFMVKP